MNHSEVQQCSIISRIKDKVVLKKDRIQNKQADVPSNGNDTEFSAFNGLIDNTNSIHLVGACLGSPLNISIYA